VTTFLLVKSQTQQGFSKLKMAMPFLVLVLQKEGLPIG